MADGSPIERPSLETPAPAETKPAPVRRRRPTRTILFALLPVMLVVGGYLYATGGEVVSIDNAYVQADIVGISTDVAGTVASVEVKDNQQVKAGEVLFRLDRKPFEIALAGAQAQLGIARNEVLTLQASYRQSLAEIAQAEADLPYFEATFRRQQDLEQSAAASKAAYDKAVQDLSAAKQKVAVAKAEAEGTLAKLGGDADQPVEKNPSFLQAKAAVDTAQRNLDDSVVHAPFDGIVTNVPSLQVGSYLQAAQQAFSLVSTTNLWVAVNPKETELTYVEPGQRVSIEVDTYPGEVWSGTVGSISPASAASFALLPAQNSSGNWVKVVQRIPMTVKIDDLSGKPPLRVGMSVVVDVDTGHARGLPTVLTGLFGGWGASARPDHG